MPYPGHDELAADAVDVSLDLACDVQLVAVEGDTLKIRDQVLLGRRIRALCKAKRQAHDEIVSFQLKNNVVFVYKL